MRTITAVTVGRSDWGIYRPVLDHISRDPDLRLQIVASGAHLTTQSGNTVDEIVRDGFEIKETVNMLMSSDTPVGIAKSMGVAVMGFADCYDRVDTDILLLLGDRFEMHAAAVAAIPFGIPIAHIHGGEVTHGAMDDAFRHAITKYSHLHFASNAQHARRIVQLGEEPWRVTVSGAPGLDNLVSIKLLSLNDVERRLEMQLDEPPVIVTFHPVTLQRNEAESHVSALMEALSNIDKPIVVTRPNADTGHTSLTEQLHSFCMNHPRAAWVDNLGTQMFFSLMREGFAMLGNSSSGIIEAASFQLPVINIGDRQAGRARSANTIDVACEASQILDAYQTICTENFREQMRSVRNVYGDGNAAGIIVNKLKSIELDDRLRMKQFFDVDCSDPLLSAA